MSSHPTAGAAASPAARGPRPGLDDTAPGDTAPAGDGAPPAAGPRRPWPASFGLPLVPAAVALVVGVVLRFVVDSHLWLDEALTVDISRMSVPDILSWLRHDGSPPLYYLLLHGWIGLFGTGSVAVRSLSGVLSVAALPAAWLLARRLVPGRRFAATAVLLLAASPYAVRYATETRMYTLIVLLVLLGGLALEAALRRPGLWSRVWLGLSALALAYTHYWALFLLLALEIALVGYAWLRRGTAAAPTARAALAAAGSIALAGVGFLPWLPSFLYQSAHTGAPWAAPAQASALLHTVQQWSGPGSPGALMFVLLLLLAVVGVTARRPGTAARLELHLRGRPLGLVLLAAFLGPLVVALVVAMSGHTAWAVRYTAIAFPAFLLLAALGMVALPGRVRTGVLALTVVIGLVGGLTSARTERTEAGIIAARINRDAAAGDVVAYCPDQLGPAVQRLLHVDVRQVAFADPSGPQLVDWVDYAQRMRDAQPEGFAAELDALAGAHTVWLVRADGYRTLDDSCARVAAALVTLRPRPVGGLGSAHSPDPGPEIPGRSHFYENASLQRFPAT